MQLSQLITFLSFSTVLVAGAPSSAASKCKTNTFANGNFDGDTLSPWGSGGSTNSSVTLHSPGQGGTKYAVALSAQGPVLTGHPDGTAEIYQSINLCPNTAYTVKLFYAAQAATSSTTHLYVYLNGNVIYETQGSIGTTYKQAVGSFTTGSNATDQFLSVELDIPDIMGSATLYVDTISVVAG